MIEKSTQNAQSWLSDAYDSTTRLAVQKLINTKGEDLIESFYKDLDFGTGGMRGIMGVGSNRINKYTINENKRG